MATTTTATSSPDREHMLAINTIAARHRTARSETRAWLREPVETWASRERLAGLLLGDPLPHLASVRVLDVLCWCRGVRHHKAERMLRHVGIKGLRVIGQLTPRQCLALAGELRHGYHDQLALT